MGSAIMAAPFTEVCRFWCCCRFHELLAISQLYGDQPTIDDPGGAITWPVCGESPGCDGVPMCIYELTWIPRCPPSKSTTPAMPRKRSVRQNVYSVRINRMNNHEWDCSDCSNCRGMSNLISLRKAVTGRAYSWAHCGPRYSWCTTHVMFSLR